METLEEADKAIGLLNGKKIGSRMIWVKYSKPRLPREEKKGGFGESRQPYGRSRGDFYNKKDEGFKRYGNFNQDRQNDRNESGQRGHYGRSNNNDQEGGYRNNRQNNFRNNDKRDYQPTKESSGCGRTEGGRVEQPASKKPCEEQDY